MGTQEVEQQLAALLCFRLTLVAGEQRGQEGGADGKCRVCRLPPALDAAAVGSGRGCDVASAGGGETAAGAGATAIACAIGGAERAELAALPGEIGSADEMRLKLL